MTDACCAVPREQPTGGEKCPECGVNGKVVDLQTVKALLLPEALRILNTESAFRFCAQPGCSTVYFSPDQSFAKSALRVPVLQKDDSPQTPVCYCFGFARGDIKDKAGARETSKAISGWVKGGKCACEMRNPQGSCCLGNIGGLF